MLRRLSPHRLAFVCTLFCSFLSARGAGSSTNEFTRSSNSDGGSSFHLAPMDAAHFGLCIIFAGFSAFQTLKAASNICRRIFGLPLSISSPDFSVGFIFPTSLLISIICRTISYTLHAVYWGRTTNLKDRHRPAFTPTYLGAWNATGFLADIFLLAAILALLSHREKVLLNTSRITRYTKKISDAIVIGILTGLSMGYVGLEVVVGDETVQHKLYRAYLSVFLFGVLNVAVHSTILCVYSRDSSVNDHSITLYTSFIISPLFFVYSVFPLLLEDLLDPSSVPSADANDEQWALASLAVGCFTEVIIVQVCLMFGMPRSTEGDSDDDSAQSKA